MQGGRQRAILPTREERCINSLCTERCHVLVHLPNAYICGIQETNSTLANNILACRVKAHAIHHKEFSGNIQVLCYMLFTVSDQLNNARNTANAYDMIIAGQQVTQDSCCCLLSIT